MNATATIPDIFERARRAQIAWARTSIRDRLKVLRRFRLQLPSRADDLVAAVAAARVRAPGETLASEILPLAEACRFLERRTQSIFRPRRLRTRLLPLWLSGVSAEIRREPHGIVLILGPSNYPLFLAGAQALQALAAGNAVIFKPGRSGAPTAKAIAELLQTAGLPDDLFVVLDESVETAKGALHAGADKIILTGSAETGRAVLRETAESLTPSTMELSGCDAAFVLPSANLDNVARAVAFGMRLNCGATCIAPHRIFISASLASSLEKRLVSALTEVCPCAIDPVLFERANALLSEAKASGACQLTGQGNTAEGFAPVMLADASPTMRILQSDLFCGIVALLPVRTMDEALELDRQCPYALGASVFGEQRAALALARRINAGSVCVNDLIAPTADPRLPFGGRKQSGFGTTRGAEGLLEMSVVKAIAIRHGKARPHYRANLPNDEHLMRALLRASHSAGLATSLRAVWRAVRLMIRRPDSD